MQAHLRFYERTDDGRRRILKTVEAPAGSTLEQALELGSRVMAATEPVLVSRIVEVRVALVEVAVAAKVPV